MIESAIAFIQGIDKDTAMVFFFLSGIASMAFYFFSKSIKNVAGILKRPFKKTITFDYKQGYIYHIFASWLAENIDHCVILKPRNQFLDERIVNGNHELSMGVGNFILNIPNLPFILISIRKLDDNTKNTGTNLPMVEISLSVYGTSYGSIQKKMERVVGDIRRKQKEKEKDWDYTFSGDFFRIFEFSRRNLDRIVMDEEKKENVISNIDNFFSEETRQFYEGNNIPYKRGMLLYGPPGTGKTSFVLALRTYFNKKIYRINLNEVASDKQLEEALIDIDRNSIILFEDIDCVKSSSNREKKDSSGVVSGNKSEEEEYMQSFGVSLSGLLNALDGALSPEGVLFVMTTNYKDRLDDALIRPGRIDMWLKMDYLDSEKQKTFIRKFFNDGSLEFPEFDNGLVAPSTLQELCLQCYLSSVSMEDAKNKAVDNLVNGYSKGDIL